MTLLSVSLALSLVLNILFVLADRSSKRLVRERERERNQWQAERTQLIEKVMLQKGYREFAPPVMTPAVLESEWKEESEEEGFLPL